MTSSGSDYQRRYLRAPYKKDVLFVDEDFVFKAQTLNISEGGLLLDQVGHFPGEKKVTFLVEIPEFPLFKNFTLEKLQAFSYDSVLSRVIRFKAKMVRSIKIESSIDGVFTSKIGLSFVDVAAIDQLKVSSYVENFSSNLVYLQVLIDTLATDESQIKKIRLLAHYLGYSDQMKISYLRKIVEHDYKSLQWL